VLPQIAFVAQDQPLYPGFTGEELMTLGARLNRRWDDRLVRQRLRRLGIPLDRPVGKLSGGQRAQVALSLSLAKQADLVLLDEPLASLDPLARQEFLQTLMEAIAESGATVILSSHIVDELEQVCDYVVILSTARVQLAMPIEEALSTHKRLIGPVSGLDALASVHDLVTSNQTPRQATAVVRANGAIFDPAWDIHAMSLQEVVLAYLSKSRQEESQPALAAR
jgi:ABC-2 type transport system ATP-binding protein